MTKRPIFRLGRDRKGSTSVEFAIVAPTFLLLLLAIFDVSYMVFVQTVLDGAARDAARLVRTGQVQANGDPSGAFQTQLCNGISAVVGCGNVVFDVQTFANWTAAATTLNNPVTRDGQGNFSNPQFTPGAAGSIVAVRVSYNRSFMTSWIQSVMGNTAFLMSTVIFQNEPFKAGS